MRGEVARGRATICSGGCARGDEADLAADARRLIAGEAGRRLGEAGLMAAIVDARGPDPRRQRRLRAPRRRAEGEAVAVEGTPLVDHLAALASGQFHFAAEGKAAPPLRIVQVPAGDGAESLSFFLLLDDVPGPRGEDETAHVHALLDSLPLGLALADGDGRFLFLNKVFRKAVGLAAERAAGLARRPRRRRGQGRGLRRGPPLRPRPAACRATSRCGSRPIPRSRWR